MLRFNPDGPLELGRVADLRINQPLILVTNPGTTAAVHEYVNFARHDETAITVHRRARTASQSEPTCARLPIKTKGSTWELYPTTQDVVVATGNVVIFAGEDPDRPGELQLFIDTPTGRLIATPNSDPEYPEIYVEYRAAAVGTSAPDRQVAVLQFDSESPTNGFRMCCYEDDESDDLTNVFRGRQLPPEIDVTRDNATHVTFNYETFDLTTPTGVFDFLTSDAFKTCLRKNEIENDVEYHDDGTSVIRLPYHDGTRNVAVRSAADVWDLLEELHDVIVEDTPRPAVIDFSTKISPIQRGEN